MISIIIPVLNEEKNIENLLNQVSNLNGEKEIIVVDGGSIDNTVSIAKKYGKVIISEKGRANQMNLGVSESKGEILWFVHSDSKLDINSLLYIQDAVKNGFNAGGFSLYFHDYNTNFMKFVAKSSNLRAKFLGLFYGDQGIFVKKDVFNKINGYPNIEIMEDWQFSRNLYKNYKMTLLKTSIGTSGRRFKEGGQLKTLLLMHKLKILYLLNVSPKRLVRIYREAR